MTQHLKLTADNRDSVLNRLSQLDLKRPIRITLKEWRSKRTSAQNALLWKWHTQVAAEFTAFTGKHWTAESVHYRFFCPKFLGGEVVELPDGTKSWASETSSEQDTATLRDAMDSYMAWCINNDIELTDPEGY